MPLAFTTTCASAFTKLPCSSFCEAPALNTIVHRISIPITPKPVPRVSTRSGGLNGVEISRNMPTLPNKLARHANER
ncbi:hypothetical protein GY45DRAFT_1332010 [Cubamyces sp. BRFM 1775]|nr:hypothetical protein GY45DRAFT_1332010 [Cubamyces sp. BRFM 1775]